MSQDIPRPGPRLAVISRHDTPVPPSEVRLDGEGDEKTKPRTVSERLDDLEAAHKATQGSVRACLAQGRETRKILEERFDRFEERTSHVVAGLTRKLDETQSAVSRLEARPDHTIAIGHIVEVLGTPPQKIDVLRASQIGQLTAAELTELERGTGVQGMIGRLVAHDVRVAQAAGKAAGVAAGEAAGKSAAKSASRRTGAVTASASAAVVVLAETADHWGPPVVRLLSSLFGG